MSSRRKGRWLSGSGPGGASLNTLGPPWQRKVCAGSRGADGGGDGFAASWLGGVAGALVPLWTAVDEDLALEIFVSTGMAASGSWCSTGVNAEYVEMVSNGTGSLRI